MSIPRVLADALQASGICNKIFDQTSISGGCVNNAFKVNTDAGPLFVKTNNGQNALTMFEGESEALKAINDSVPDFAPKPLCTGSLPTRGAFLVTTFLSLISSRSKNQQVLLAQKLAKLHSTYSPNNKFGFPVTTMCGTTEQDNTWVDNWEVFFKERRLFPLLQKSGDKEIQSLGKIVAEKVIPLLMNNIETRPSLIHGDLWSGNWGVNSETNEPVIFDPAAYYGHNEMELSIMTMFGSPSADFFEEYHSHHPQQEPFFKERQELYQLYHYLNHFHLFGGGYRDSSISIMKGLCRLVSER